MLKFFNRLEKTRNFVLLIFAVLMVVSLVFLGPKTQRGILGMDLAHSQETAAKVSGEKISVAEIVRLKDSYAQFSRGQSFPSSMLINGLISSRIIRLEAARLGPDSERCRSGGGRSVLRNKTEDGRPFDQKKYEENVAAQYGSIAAYEEDKRDDVSARKLQAFLTSGVTVSEEEVPQGFSAKKF
jgi:hypothetical protein